MCTYDDVQYYCPWLDEDVNGVPRYEAADVPRSALQLAAGTDVCLSNADDAAFDPACVQMRPQYLPMLFRMDDGFCPQGMLPDAFAAEPMRGLRDLRAPLPSYPRVAMRSSERGPPRQPGAARAEDCP